MYYFILLFTLLLMLLSLLYYYFLFLFELLLSLYIYIYINIRFIVVILTFLISARPCSFFILAFLNLVDLSLCFISTCFFRSICCFSRTYTLKYLYISTSFRSISFSSISSFLTRKACSFSF